MPQSWSSAGPLCSDLDSAKSKFDAKSVLFVDARPAAYFQRGHIPGAVNLPNMLFDFVYMMKLARTDPKKEIIVYGRDISKHHDEETAFALSSPGPREYQYNAGQSVRLAKKRIPFGKMREHRERYPDASLPGPALQALPGALFIYASMYKINLTAEFAESIASYQMIPHWGVNLAAAGLPWTELICGALLLLGIRSRSASAVCLFLLIFTAGIAVKPVEGCPHKLRLFPYGGREDKLADTGTGHDLGNHDCARHFFDRCFHLERKFSLAFGAVRT